MLWPKMSRENLKSGISTPSILIHPGRLEIHIALSNTVDSFLTDTSVKQTPRVGPCLCLFPLFDAL